MKMNQIANTITSIVVTFLITNALLLGTDWIFGEKGSVKIGRAFVIEGKNYIPVDITNYRNEPISDVIFSIPASMNHASIQSSGPLQIELIPDAVGKTNRKRIKISGIEPRQVTTVMLPTLDQKDSEMINVVNAGQKNLKIEDVKELRHPLLSKFIDMLHMSIFTALTIGILGFWLESRADKIATRGKELMEENQKKLNDAIKESNQLHEKYREQNIEIISMTKRMQILLIAKLKDYSKELNFWRNTIRKILYHTADNNKTADKIFELVTNELKTYRIRSDISQDIDAIKIAEILLQKPNKKSDSNNESELNYEKADIVLAATFPKFKEVQNASVSQVDPEKNSGSVPKSEE
jgi:hypothetical protein